MWSGLSRFTCVRSVFVLCTSRAVNFTYAVPARGEDDGGADTTGAWLVGELGGVVGTAGRAVAAHDGFAFLEAAVADAGILCALFAEGRVAGEHAEAL